MSFALRGVVHEGNVRRFTFESTHERAPRLKIVVDVDLSLARKHKIPLQELPLLCLGMLEALTPTAAGTVPFAEKDMIAFSARRAEEKSAADRKRLARRFSAPASHAHKPRLV
jgi:hypothetical protein